MNRNKRKGLQFEEKAKAYLCGQGLEFVDQNYHSRFGEIDLIMRDKDTLCFIEVKFRKTLNYGGAANAISCQKQQKIVRTAQVFIQEFQKLNRLAMRFDALVLQQSDTGISVDWIQNAFYAE